MSTNLLPYAQPYLTCALPSLHSSLLSFPADAAPSSASKPHPGNRRFFLGCPNELNGFVLPREMVQRLEVQEHTYNYCH